MFYQYNDGNTALDLIAQLYTLLVLQIGIAVLIDVNKSYLQFYFTSLLSWHQTLIFFVPTFQILCSEKSILVRYF